MANTYPYTDGYLAPHVTQAREAQAIAEVDMIGSFTAAWKQRLVILRAYIITCMECSKSADDMFAAKLASYRHDFTASLPLARAAKAAEDAAAGAPQVGAGSVFSVPLERC